MPLLLSIAESSFDFTGGDWEFRYCCVLDYLFDYFLKSVLLYVLVLFRKFLICFLISQLSIRGARVLISSVFQDFHWCIILWIIEFMIGSLQLNCNVICLQLSSDKVLLWITRFLVLSLWVTGTRLKPFACILIIPFYVTFFWPWTFASALRPLY